MNEHWLEPDWDPYLSIQNISINYLLKKDIKLILLDVDNTLLPRRELIIDQSVITWLTEAKKYLKLHLISNNPSKSRIMSIANQIKVSFTYGASKPRRKKVQEVISKFDFNTSNIAIVGDRIFTDVLVGNRLGLYTILVKPIKSDGRTSKNNYSQEIERYLSKIFGAFNK